MAALGLTGGWMAGYGYENSNQTRAGDVFKADIPVNCLFGEQRSMNGKQDMVSKCPAGLYILAEFQCKD